MSAALRAGVQDVALQTAKAVVELSARVGALEAELRLLRTPAAMRLPPGATGPASQWSPALDGDPAMTFRESTLIMRRLVADAAAMFEVGEDEIRGEGKTARICEARDWVMAAGQDAGCSSPQIGWDLGGRDHSTVLKGARRGRQRRDAWPVPVFVSRRTRPLMIGGAT